MRLPDLVPLACPHCGIPVDGFDDVAGDACPAEGVVSVCGHCLGVSIFADSRSGLVLRRPDLEERSRLVGDERVLNAMAALIAGPSIRDAVATVRRTTAGRNLRGVGRFAERGTSWRSCEAAVHGTDHGMVRHPPVPAPHADVRRWRLSRLGVPAHARSFA